MLTDVSIPETGQMRWRKRGAESWAMGRPERREAGNGKSAGLEAGLSGHS